MGKYRQVYISERLHKEVEKLASSQVPRAGVSDVVEYLIMEGILNVVNRATVERESQELQKAIMEEADGKPGGEETIQGN